MTTDIVKDDLPCMTPELAKDVMQRYQMMCRALLEPSDYAEIQGKKYKKRSAYRKLARAFNISDEIIKEEREGDTWRIHVKASSRSGRSSVGIGACSLKERAFAHPDHDTYATAHTRAKNRAISDLLGAGEVSAEEVHADQPTPGEFWEVKDGKPKK